MVPKSVFYREPTLGLNEATGTSGQEALLSSQIPLLPMWLFSNMVMMVEVEVEFLVVRGGCLCVCLCRAP